MDLEHDILEVLAKWTGEGPQYLIIDALDAAETAPAQGTLPEPDRAGDGSCADDGGWS